MSKADALKQVSRSLYDQMTVGEVLAFERAWDAAIEAAAVAFEECNEPESAEFVRKLKEKDGTQA